MMRLLSVAALVGGVLRATNTHTHALTCKDGPSPNQHQKKEADPPPEIGRLEGQKRRITRKKNKRLWNEFDKIMQKRAALPKEGRDGHA